MLGIFVVGFVLFLRFLLFHLFHTFTCSFCGFAGGSCCAIKVVYTLMFVGLMSLQNERDRLQGVALQKIGPGIYKNLDYPFHQTPRLNYQVAFAHQCMQIVVGEPG